MDSYRCFWQLFDFFNRTNSSSMIEYNVTFEYYMLWTSDLFWTRLMCTSLFVLPLVPVSIAVLGQPSWYILSVVDQISDQVQVTPYLNEVQPDTTWPVCENYFLFRGLPSKSWNKKWFSQTGHVESVGLCLRRGCKYRPCLECPSVLEYRYNS